MVLDIILFLRQSERQAIQIGCLFLPAIYSYEQERLEKPLRLKNRNCTAPLITWETSENRNISTNSLVISSYLTVQATQRNLS